MMTNAQRTIVSLLGATVVLLALNLLVQMPPSSAEAQVGSGSKVHEVIRTEHLEIVDSSGATRMHLGLTDQGFGVLILGGEQQGRAGVLVDRSGAGKVFVRDREGRESTIAPQTRPDDAATVTVHVTATGTKYHRAGCRYLSKSDIPVSHKDAKRRGYTPCKACRPG